MEKALETEEYNGYTIEIHADMDPQDPRKWCDHAGKLCLFHNNYRFPNESKLDMEELQELVKRDDVYLSLIHI